MPTAGRFQIGQTVESLAALVGMPSAALVLLSLVLIALLMGTVARLTRRRDGDSRRIESLKTWWALLGLLIAAVWLGRLGAVALFTVGSVLAYREYVALTLEPGDAPTARYIGYVLVVLNYAWIMLDRRLVWLLFIPAASVAVFATQMVVTGQIRHFRPALSALVMGVVLVNYLPSHAAGLTLVAADRAMGLLVFLLILTEVNDIAQAHVGRAVGHRKIVPAVSPKKTWMGLAGGIVATALVAMSLGSLLRPEETGLPGGIRLWPMWMACLGALVAVAGFFGDTAISGLKRDRGVKDAGTLLPGHGGVLDRIDSLLFTAPVFFYAAVWCWDLALE